jgi:hypothetical protein
MNRMKFQTFLLALFLFSRLWEIFDVSKCFAGIAIMGLCILFSVINKCQMFFFRLTTTMFKIQAYLLIMLRNGKKNS